MGLVRLACLRGVIGLCFNVGPNSPFFPRCLCLSQPLTDMDDGDRLHVRQSLSRSAAGSGLRHVEGAIPTSPPAPLGYLNLNNIALQGFEASCRRHESNEYESRPETHSNVHSTFWYLYCKKASDCMIFCQYYTGCALGKRPKNQTSLLLHLWF